MVSLKDVRNANLAFKASKSRPNMVALFVGATSGIGLGTLKQFTIHATAPTIYIVGRSMTKAESILAELTGLNPDARLNFIESEISLIKNVDVVCDEIQLKEKCLDLIFMTPGWLKFGGRIESSEGIDIPQALRYYCRLRFVHNLLPLLNKSDSARVVAIMGGGKEVALNFDDLEYKNNFDAIKAGGNGSTQTTLAFEELAKTNPNVAFIHKYPGFVDTDKVVGLVSGVKGVLAVPATFARWVLVPLVNMFSTSIDVAGERGFYIGTSPRYPPSQSKAVAPEITPAKCSSYTDGIGNGVYLLNPYDESQPDAPIMPEYRANGCGKLVWEDTQKVWSRALARHESSI